MIWVSVNNFVSAYESLTNNVQFVIKAKNSVWKTNVLKDINHHRKHWSCDFSGGFRDQFSTKEAQFLQH